MYLVSRKVDTPPLLIKVLGHTAHLHGTSIGCRCVGAKITLASLSSLAPYDFRLGVIQTTLLRSTLDPGAGYKCNRLAAFRTIMQHTFRYYQ